MMIMESIDDKRLLLQATWVFWGIRRCRQNASQPDQIR